MPLEPGNIVCSDCNKWLIKNFNIKKIPHLNTFYAYNYDHIIRNIIISYKFDKRIELAPLLADIYKKILNNLNIKKPCLIFVPGFNNKDNHLNPIKKIFDIYAFDGVKKIKFTKKQRLLKRKERLENLKGAFKLIKNLPPNKTPIIIDDVITTGSTFNAVKEAIKKDCIGIMIAHRRLNG